MLDVSDRGIHRGGRLPFLSEANANLIVTHGTREQIETYAIPVIEGRWFGTMALSEPQAGSSLGDITTLATPDAAGPADGPVGGPADNAAGNPVGGTVGGPADNAAGNPVGDAAGGPADNRTGDPTGGTPAGGTYRLRGTKMWISGGDHELSENIVHLVLARTPDAPAGPKGISLFIVPKRLVGPDGELGERNGVILIGLNHKMGYRGTTNTLLEFDSARGELVGQVGAGLAIMFDMMNEARIGVGEEPSPSATRATCTRSTTRARVRRGVPSATGTRHPRP